MNLKLVNAFNSTERIRILLVFLMETCIVITGDNLEALLELQFSLRGEIYLLLR